MVLPPLPKGLRTRIAPTPSGLLHAGNGASFVLTDELARAAGGHVLLRIDDLDEERVRLAFTEDIFRTLHWLGVIYHGGPVDRADLMVEWSQHFRTDHYATLLEEMRQQGRVYACTCTRSTLASCQCRTAGKDLHAPDTVWRLDLSDAPPVTMHRWPGPAVQLDIRALMPVDPVVRQRGGRAAYQVASLSDDLAFRINFVVRGQDLLPSTAVQLHMARSLGREAFLNTTFVHHGLLKDASGAKLSKSAGAASLMEMQARGESPGLVHDLADELLVELVRAVQA